MNIMDLIEKHITVTATERLEMKREDVAENVRRNLAEEIAKEIARRGHMIRDQKDDGTVEWTLSGAWLSMKEVREIEEKLASRVAEPLEFDGMISIPAEEYHELRKLLNRLQKYTG